MEGADLGGKLSIYPEAFKAKKRSLDFIPNMMKFSKNFKQEQGPLRLVC
jgi:hypothetical protein